MSVQRNITCQGTLSTVNYTVRKEVLIKLPEMGTDKQIKLASINYILNKHSTMQVRHKINSFSFESIEELAMMERKK